MIVLGAAVLLGSDGLRIEVGARLGVMTVMFVDRDRIARMFGKVSAPCRGRRGEHQRADSERHINQ